MRLNESNFKFTKKLRFVYIRSLLLYIYTFNILLFLSSNYLICGPEKDRFVFGVYYLETDKIYFELVYLVTAFVPSETACLANSPGNKSRTAVCISRDVIVDRLL